MPTRTWFPTSIYHEPLLRSGLERFNAELAEECRNLRAFDAAGKVVATFPATVGSTERPAPSGRYAVRVVVRNPAYTYDPKRLTFGRRSQGRLTLRPGPNNPVGTTWIALTIETYGIHGTPDPRMVGKTASHGCVRLTNWDAAALGQAVGQVGQGAHAA